MTDGYLEKSRLVTIFAPWELITRIDILAKENQRSRSAMIRMILRDYLINEEKKKEAAKPRGILRELDEQWERERKS